MTPTFRGPSSPERATRDILSRKERGPANTDAGQVSYDAMPEIQRRLREIAEVDEVDTVALKRQVRRVLVLDLADAEDAYNRRETIKLLGEMEGYRKAPVKADGGEGDGGTDAELERLSKAARGD